MTHASTLSSAAAPAPNYSRREQRTALIALILGLFIAALDQTIVVTAGPQIQKSLDIPPALYAWISTAYLVTSTVMMPIWGKLGDLYGRRAILVLGVVIFLGGSFLCGAAGEPFFDAVFHAGAEELILFRAIQGIGGAALITTAFASVADLFPPAERGKYVGMNGGVYGVASVIGPFLGGFLTDTLSWRWIFYVNLPFGIVVLLFIARMPALRHLFARGDRMPRIDFWGALWLFVGIVPLLIALSLGRGAAPGEAIGYAWNSGPVLALAAVAAAGVVAFLATEARASDPILPLELFGNRIFSLGSLGAFLLSASFLGPILFLPLFAVDVIGSSVTDAGLTLTPFSVATAVGGVFTGRLVNRLGGYRPVMLASLATIAFGYLLFSLTLSAGSGLAEITLEMIIVGLGFGFAIPLYILAVQNGTDRRHIGAATGAVTFFRNIGQAVGVASSGAIFANPLLSRLASGSGDERLALADATGLVFRFSLVMVLASLAVTAFLPGGARRAAGG